MHFFCFFNVKVEFFNRASITLTLSFPSALHKLLWIPTKAFLLKLTRIWANAVLLDFYHLMPHSKGKMWFITCMSSHSILGKGAMLIVFLIGATCAVYPFIYQIILCFSNPYFCTILVLKTISPVSKPIHKLFINSILLFFPILFAWTWKMDGNTTLGSWCLIFLPH